MPKSLSLTHGELYDRLSQIVRTLEVLKLSHNLFVFYSSDDIALESDEHAGGSPGRDEIGRDFCDRAGIAFGFEVIQFQFEKHGDACSW